MEPFPGCNAKYSALCSVQYAIRLVTRARVEACPDIESGGTTRQAALEAITAGRFEADGAVGFGVFVLSTDNYILADAVRPDLVGELITGRLASGYIAQVNLPDYIDWVTSYGGGFVPHYSTRVNETPIDVDAGDSPLEASAYFEQCATGERLGVAFGRQEIPRVEPCEGHANRKCAAQNVRSNVGNAIVDILNTATFHQLSEVHYKMSYTTEYYESSWNCFISHMSWYGYPGSDPYRNQGILPDTENTIFALGGGASTFVGWNDSYVIPGETHGTTVATYGIASMSAGAYKGGAWQDVTGWFPWMPISTQILLTVGYMINGTAYMLGCGQVWHDPGTPELGPRCETCTADVALPCTSQNVQRLSAHATMEFMTPEGGWDRIGRSQWFGATRSDLYAETFDRSGTWPAGFYVRGVAYNGSVVADGADGSNEGKDIGEVLGDSTLHARFKLAADSGGAWIGYQNSSGAAKLAQVTKAAKHGESFYITVTMDNAWAPWESDCSSAYAEPCAERNAEALVGKVVADLLSAEDSEALQAVIDEVVEGQGIYSEDSVGDFQATIWSTELECVTSDGSCSNEWPYTWQQLVMDAAAPEDGAWVTLPALDSYSAVRAYVGRLEWANPTSVDSQDLLVVVMIADDDAPPHCTLTSDCPSNALCNEYGRCECDTDYLPNFTLDEGGCGEFAFSTMECISVRNQICNTVEDCSPCPAGYSCTSGVASACKAGFVCPAGETMYLCPQGTMGNSSRASDSSACIPCAAGKFSSAEGQTECDLCEPGTAINSTGQASCERCLVGTYQESYGSATCTACPSELTTMYRSSIYARDCVCPRLTYFVLETGHCEACPEGLQCDEPNTTTMAIPTTLAGTSEWPFPTAQAEYMTLLGAPLAPYLCKDPVWCPGGSAGTCADGRDGMTIGCSKCLPGKYSTSDGQCVDCEAGAATLIMIAGFLGLFTALAFFARVVLKSHGNQSNAMTVLIISGGLGVSAIQTLGIFSNLTVRWIDPVSSMFKIMGLFAFDLQVLRVECLVGQSSVSNLILRQLVAPVAALYMLFIVFLQKTFRDHTVDIIIQATNAIGSIFQLFFVSVFVSALSPLICYAHPGDQGYSMVNDPAILCNIEGNHRSMVVVSALAVGLIIVPYLAVTSHATARYKAIMASSSASSRHLRQFRFLFFRYTPNCYWYGVATLFRGVCMCLILVVARDAPALQILAAGVTLISFSTMQMYFKPWRGKLPNIMDAGVCMLLVLLLLCVAMTTEFEGTDDLLGILAAVVFALVFVSIFGAVANAGFKHMLPTPFYPRFLCHHKADAAAQARYIQLLLVSKSAQLCFLDSDNLTNVEDLLDIVRCRCGRLVVYLMSQTLKRPWCAGEITTCWQSHQRAVAVHHPSFVPPSPEEIKADVVAEYLATADFKLVEYGISDLFIQSAFRWLLDEMKDKVQVSQTLVGRAKFERVTEDILCFGMDKINILSAMSSRVKMERTGSSDDSQSTSRRSQLVISSQINSDEATSAAAILAGRLQSQIVDVVPAGILVLADLDHPGSEEAMQAVSSAHAVLVILTEGSLQSVGQLQVIMNAIGEDVFCLPVNCPSFRFPEKKDLKGSLERFFPDKGEAIEERIKIFFKTISVSLTTYGSLQVLDTQATALAARIPKARNSGRRKTMTSLRLGKSSDTLPSFVSQPESEAVPLTYCAEIVC